MNAEELVAACDAAGFCQSIRETLEGKSLDDFMFSTSMQKSVGFDFGRVLASCEKLQRLIQRSGTRDFEGMDTDLVQSVKKMRNAIIHEYDEIVNPRIYEFCKETLPEFEAALRCRIAHSGLDCTEPDKTRENRFFRRWD